MSRQSHIRPILRVATLAAGIVTVLAMQPAPAGAQLIVECALSTAALQHLSTPGPTDSASRDRADDLAYLAASLPLFLLLLHHGSAQEAIGSTVETPPIVILPGGTESGGSSSSGGKSPDSGLAPQPAGAAASVPEPGVLATLLAPAAAFALTLRRRSRARP